MSVAKPRGPLFLVTAAAVLFLVTPDDCPAAELQVGGATLSITPAGPVALSGQMHTRIAREVRSPVMATALAMESRDGGKVLDQALMVSCDLVAIDQATLDRVHKQLKGRLPDFDSQKLVINATHTHTAPVLEEGKYEIPKLIFYSCASVFDVSPFVMDRESERSYFHSATSHR
jgi:hypothetical protein